jgi:hypothetical protein
MATRPVKRLSTRGPVDDVAAKLVYQLNDGTFMKPDAPR